MHIPVSHGFDHGFTVQFLCLLSAMLYVCVAIPSIGVINQLSRACLESTRSVYPILANLQSLVEVEEVSEVLRG